MTKRRSSDRYLEPISRELLETTAKIIGPNSAAARALEEAARCGGDVCFYRCTGSIIVMKESTIDQDP